MKINYLFKRQVNELDKESIFRIIYASDGKEILLFNYARYLVLVDADRNSIQSRLPITVQTCKESAKAFFKDKKKGHVGKSMSIMFPLNILSFAVETESASISVLTRDSKLFLLSTKTLVDHLMSLPISTEDQAPKDQSRYELDVDDDVLSSVVQSLPTPSATLLSKAQNLQTYFESFSLNILFMANRSLFRLTTMTMPSDEIKWKQSTLAKLESSVYTNSSERSPKVFPLRIRESSGLIVCPLLCNLLFGKDSRDVVTLLSLPSGHVFFVNSRTSEKKLICDLRQPLLFCSTISLSSPSVDSSTPCTVYNSKTKATSDKLIKSFMAKQRNNCIIFIGALGKLIFLFPPDDSNVVERHDNQVSYEHQLPLPVTACACKNNLLFVSDSKNINVYQLSVCVKEKRRVTDGTEVVENILVPGFELVHVIPVCNVIKIEVLGIDPIVLCCMNKKSHIFIIDTCGVREPSLPVVHQDLNTLIEELASKQAELNNVKEVSKKLNEILRDTKGVVAIVHKHNRNKPLIGPGKTSSFPLRFAFNSIHCNNERKLFVTAQLLNNSSFPLPCGWYLSIRYHQHISTALQNFIRCRNECFKLPPLQPNTSYEFSFLIKPCFIGYTIKMDVYLNHRFQGLECETTEYERLCGGISLFMMSQIVSVADVCGIVDNVNNQIPVVPTNHSCRVEPGKQQRSHPQKYSCIHPITELQINFLYSKFKVDDHMRTNVIDSVSELLFRYLKGRKTRKGCNSMTLVHLNGSCVELRLLENEEKTHGWDFNLHISSPSFTLLIAFSHFMSSMFESVPNEGVQFKRILEHRLSKLKELFDVLGSSPNVSGGQCKEDAMAKLRSVAVELRSFIL